MGCGSVVSSHGTPTPAAIFSVLSGKIAALTCGSEVPIILDSQLMFHRDKHEYSALLRETHPTRCTLTGNRRLVKRTPDETFALSTHERGDFVKPSLNAGVFRQDRLQRLLLHPKCGLISIRNGVSQRRYFPLVSTKPRAGQVTIKKREDKLAPVRTGF